MLLFTLSSTLTHDRVGNIQFILLGYDIEVVKKILFNFIVKFQLRCKRNYLLNPYTPQKVQKSLVP